MNLRHALFDLSAEHQLSAAQARQLQQFAGLAAEPPQLARWLPRGVAVLATGLGGLGVVMWVAANWADWGRTGRFGLLQALVLLAALGAATLPKARTALGLLCLMGVGALLAFFGQTYQTGADPWQLFALWAALALPLCLGARSDALWMPWAVVVSTGIALWTFTHLGHRWRVAPDDLPVQALAWLATLALVAGLSPAAHRLTGAGIWAQRTAITLSVLGFTMTALGGLFHDTVAPQYALGLLAMVVTAAALSTPRWFDIFALSAVTLALNALLVSGLARWLFNRHQSDWIGAMLLLGLTAAGLLAASVSGILRLSRRASLAATLPAATGQARP